MDFNSILCFVAQPPKRLLRVPGCLRDRFAGRCGCAASRFCSRYSILWTAVVALCVRSVPFRLAPHLAHGRAWEAAFFGDHSAGWLVGKIGEFRWFFR